MPYKFIIPALLACLSVVACAPALYRYSYIRPQTTDVIVQNYRIVKLDIRNAELLLLDGEVLSNTLHTLSAMVLENNGLIFATNGTLEVGIQVLVEDNDIINNRQSLSVIYSFQLSGKNFARYILSSSSKQLLLNKQLLVRELNNIIGSARNTLIYHAPEKK